MYSSCRTSHQTAGEVTCHGPGRNGRSERADTSCFLFTQRCIPHVAHVMCPQPVLDKSLAIFRDVSVGRLGRASGPLVATSVSPTVLVVDVVADFMHDDTSLATLMASLCCTRPPLPLVTEFAGRAACRSGRTITNASASLNRSDRH